MKRIRIGLYPYSDKNDYIQRVRTCLEQVGDVVAIPILKDVFFNPKLLIHRSANVIVVNWIENYILGRTTNKVTVLGLSVFILKLILFRILSRKMIYVKHNHFSHDINTKNLKFSKNIIGFLERISSVNVVHIGELPANDYRYIPHPLYEIELDLDRPREEKSPYFIIFGRISRYKGIENIILSLPSDKKLVIAGPGSDKGYLDFLQDISTGKNIHIIEGYVDNYTAQELIYCSSGVVIPHQGDDMIVSGTYYYAITLGVRVYAFSNAFFHWLKYELKAPGLTLMDRESGLQNCSFEAQTPNEQRLIREFAQDKFGDEQVILAWRETLTSIGFDL